MKSAIFSRDFPVFHLKTRIRLFSPTLNELPVADRDSGHAINIVDIMENASARRLGIFAEGTPQIHAVDRRQIRRIAAGGC